VDETLIDDRSSIQPYQKFLKNNFPTLEKFVYCCKANYKPFRILVDIYFFISRHHRTLKYLHIDSYETYMFPSGESSVGVSNGQYQELLNDLCRLQLKEFYFRVLTFVPDSFLRWKSLGKTSGILKEVKT